MPNQGAGTSTADRTPRRGERLHYLDWLRAAAVVGVVAYHALLPFSTIPWWVQNGERWDGLSTPLLISQTVALAVLFVISGGAAGFALRGRDGRRFVALRVRRLVVPFAFGVAVLTPLTVYIGGMVGSGRMTFAEFLAAWPAGIGDWLMSIGPSPRLFTVGFHLWFLAWLFLYSLAAPALVAWLGSPSGKRAVERLARLLRPTGATLLLGVPTVVPPVILVAVSPQQYDWWQFGWLAVYFGLGCVLLGDGRLRTAVRRDAVVAGVATLAGVAALQLVDVRGWVEAREQLGFAYDATYAAMIGLYALTAWAATVATLGAAMRWRTFGQPIPGAVGAAMLPIYVLHFPIVIGLSVAIVDMPLGLPAKSVLAVLAGLIASAAIAVVALSVPVTRRLLGVPARGAVGR